MGTEHGCRMAIARFLDRICLALQASGLWLRYATLQNFIPSPMPSTQSKERKELNFAIWQPWKRDRGILTEPKELGRKSLADGGDAVKETGPIGTRSKLRETGRRRDRQKESCLGSSKGGCSRTVHRGGQQRHKMGWTLLGSNTAIADP